jgi:hypothetical protein
MPSTSGRLSADPFDDLEQISLGKLSLRDLAVTSQTRGARNRSRQRVTPSLVRSSWWSATAS